MNASIAPIGIDSVLPSQTKGEADTLSLTNQRDIFSYDPSHLAEWEMPQSLQFQLPTGLILCTATMQLAAAAVLTSFDRLQKLKIDLLSAKNDSAHADIEIFEFDSGDKEVICIRDPGAHRTIYNYQDSDTCSTPPLSISQSSSPETGQSGFDQGFVSPMSLSPVPSDSLFSPQFALDKLEVESGLVEETISHHAPQERKLSIPLAPRSSYYIAELSDLRTNAMPRMRHAMRNLDIEVSEFHLANKLGQHQRQGDDSVSTPPASNAVRIEYDFRDWWTETKARAHEILRQAHAMTRNAGLLGLGDWAA